jgi:hypothetical protein
MQSKYIFFSPVACCFLYKAKDLLAPPCIHIFSNSLFTDQYIIQWYMVWTIDSGGKGHRSWLRDNATSRKIAGSIPDAIGFFN